MRGAPRVIMIPGHYCTTACNVHNSNRCMYQAMAKPKSTSCTIVHVRPMTRADAPQICHIWSEGLSQTTNACQWDITKRLVGPMMEKLKEHATSEDGDVGPDGGNLPKYWMERDDREMLVAESVVTKNDTKFCSNDATIKGKVVGCCGVKMGTSETQPGPEIDVGSVWRVSVDASARQSGVGRALMDEAERWIVTEGKKTNNGGSDKIMKMQLVTGNGVAADFYKAIGYRKRYWVLDYFGLPGWFEKELLYY